MGKRNTDIDAEMESDAELWARVAKSARPLAGRAAHKTPPRKPRAKPVSKGAATAIKSPSKPIPKQVPSVREVPLDRQTARRLERGAMAIEARLDLHGMRQSEAHAALKRFLKSARGKGCRHVLVITGRGAPAAAREKLYAEEARGVLRQAVPHWLAQPEFAAMIVSFAEAPRRLGGEGALYLRLRAPAKR